MNRFSSRGLMALGFVLLLFGFIVPFLMVIRVIDASFFLGFLSYVASFGGLVLGMIGAAFYWRENQQR